MKAVMISIHPKWVEKIASGENTVEVRKTVPKLAVPFKCYIYETKAQYVSYQKGALTKYGYGKGKVVGEFVCDDVIDFIRSVAGVAVCKIEKGQVGFLDNPIRVIKETCLSPSEIKGYLGNKNGYGLHISDLKIYDRPKELSEFEKTIVIPKGTQWFGNKYANKYTFNKKLTRPPKSYCFVEELNV